jgi:hypothetical protein
VPLNPLRVPAACRSLIPLAERWGVSDDHDREELVMQADEAELIAMVTAVDAVPDQELYGWLTGPESYNDELTEEYTTVTCLTMAADLARLRLSRGDRPPEEEPPVKPLAAASVPHEGRHATRRCRATQWRGRRGCTAPHV